MNSTTIYLVRHRESEKNTLGIHHSKWVEKYPLTENGKQKSENLIESFRWKTIDCIYCSPYLRCIQTVTPLATSRKTDIQIDPRITEIDVWDLDGIPVGDTWPTDRQLTADPIGITWESLLSCQKRIWNFLDEITEKYSGKCILICSHGEPLLFAKQYFLGFDYNDGLLRDSQYPAKDGYDTCVIDESWKLIFHTSYGKAQI